MNRMTGLDCAVMFNFINTHTKTHITTRSSCRTSKTWKALQCRERWQGSGEREKGCHGNSGVSGVLLRDNRRSPVKGDLKQEPEIA